MKKISSILMIALVALFSLASCGGNDPKPGKASIVGTWEVTAASMDLAGQAMDMSELVGQKLIINEDGTINADGELATYTYEGNTLTIHYQDEEGSFDQSMNVDKLTQDELVISQTETMEGMTATITLTCKRLA